MSKILLKDDDNGLGVIFFHFYIFKFVSYKKKEFKESNKIILSVLVSII